MIEEELAKLEADVELNWNNCCQTLILPNELIRKLTERIRFLEARQTELQTTGTRLIENNRMLREALSDIRSLLERDY